MATAAFACERWLKGNPGVAACPSAKNCLEALAELVFALHVRSELGGHGSGHDVVVCGQTYEVGTRSNGDRPDYYCKIADHFVDV